MYEAIILILAICLIVAVYMGVQTGLKNGKLKKENKRLIEFYEPQRQKQAPGPGTETKPEPAGPFVTETSKIEELYKSIVVVVKELDARLKELEGRERVEPDELKALRLLCEKNGYQTFSGVPKETPQKQDKAESVKPITKSVTKSKRKAKTKAKAVTQSEAKQ